MDSSAYRKLASALDALPNGFPPTDDGSELALLAYLFSPQEASLAAELHPTLELPTQIAARLGEDPKNIQKQLKDLARRGLIRTGRAVGGLGYALLPFVVGIYEMQAATIDARLAQLFEAYYFKAFGRMLTVSPSVHRVIPINASVDVDLAIQPFESAAAILNQAQAWGVIDCICRKQKALIGEACNHPIDVCMMLSPIPGAFDHSQVVKALSREEAQAVLHRAAQAGLVHSVSNSQEGLTYICNCCTCSCGILRGMADLGLANVVARSPFVSQVDESLCTACGSCLSACQFEAISIGLTAQIAALRCVGCGLCVPACPEDALSLARRADAEPPPANEAEWQTHRMAARLAGG